MQLMGDLDFKQAVNEITAAAKWLREKGAPKVIFEASRSGIAFASVYAGPN